MKDETPFCYRLVANRAISYAIYIAALIETVYYSARKVRNVYNFLLDLSNAFDRVRYDKLYKLLIGHRMPDLIVRLLLDDYM